MSSGEHIYELSDAQWCVLDLLMRAREKGVELINRLEILNAPHLPQEAAMKLVSAALTMPRDLLEWRDVHNFAITVDGMRAYHQHFDTTEPTDIADWIICLPDQSRVKS